MAILKWLGILFVAVAGVYVVAATMIGKTELLAKLFGPPKRNPVAFETLERKPSPNQFIVLPDGFSSAAEPDMRSPVFDVPVAELEGRWKERIGSRERVRLLGGDVTARQYDYEETTPLVGFPDTVTVRFLPWEEGRSTLAIYSRSHYGYGDFGANAKRVRAWLELLGD